VVDILKVGDFDEFDEIAVDILKVGKNGWQRQSNVDAWMKQKNRRCFQRRVFQVQVAIPNFFISWVQAWTLSRVTRWVCEKSAKM
jgi:hypothetical protein